MTTKQTSGSGGPGSNEAAERLREAVERVLVWAPTAENAVGETMPADLRLEDVDEALAAERRAMLSLLAGPDDRVTGADYKRAAQTLADYRAEERRATVERIRERFMAHWSDKALRRDYAFHPSLLFRILDEEAAR